MLKVLIASHNKGKIKEFNYLFKEMNLEVFSLLDYPEIEEVEETGKTFEENARLKAESIANQLKLVTLADDSGLVVPALNGQPGIYSARYSGEPKDDKRNNQKLLEEMSAFRGEDRSAYFVSTLVLAHPNHDSLVVEGKAEGIILEDLVGQEGFGYDPLFFYPPKNKSFAQMSQEEKNEVSHRSLAIDKLKSELPNWLKGIEFK